MIFFHDEKSSANRKYEVILVGFICVFEKIDGLSVKINDAMGFSFVYQIGSNGEFCYYETKYCSITIQRSIISCTYNKLCTK